MKSTEFLYQVFRQHLNQDAIVWRDKPYSYGWLLSRIENWRDTLTAKHIPPGTVVVLEGGFSPNSIALFLALIEHRCVVVPLTQSEQKQRNRFCDVARAQLGFALDENDDVVAADLDGDGQHPHYGTVRRKHHPGLVVFSTGSTGESKAAVHDLVPLLNKFRIRRRRLRSIAFLFFDHLGGINTLLYSLSNGGCLVVADDHTPDGVLAAVQNHRVDLLPTSPTFINLILLSEAHLRYDLSSLKVVTYGTEPMPASTLERFHRLFPNIVLQQTYGLSELGVLRSRSKSSDSLWVRVGGEGFQTRVVDGILQIKADSAMLGYLNAPSAFTEDGWFDTGDSVEVDGEYYRFLGRESEIINVGGQKVHPSEVESVIQEMEGVGEVTVYGEPNPIMGNIVCAKVRPQKAITRKALAAELKTFCKGKLADYKIPVKVVIDDAQQYTERFKKTRLNLISE